MDKALVEKWIAALRSDEYQQGQGFLRTAEDQYCCLGVAYEVAGGEWHAEMRAGFMSNYYLTESGYFGWLPVEYAILFGLGSSLTQDQLIAFNDNAGASFAVIADYIEREVLGHESVTSVSSTESG
jgi:hypothetical protein